MHDRPKWIVNDMIEKLVKIQAEMKYADIVKIQKNIQSKNDITSAESKDENHTCQTYKVKSMSTWESENETYQVDFGSNDRFCSCTCISFRRKQALCRHLFFLMENGYCSFTYISPMCRYHPFINLYENFSKI